MKYKKNVKFIRLKVNYTDGKFIEFKMDKKTGTTTYCHRIVVRNQVYQLRNIKQ